MDGAFHTHVGSAHKIHTDRKKPGGKALWDHSWICARFKIKNLQLSSPLLFRGTENTRSAVLSLNLSLSDRIWSRSRRPRVFLAQGKLYEISSKSWRRVDSSKELIVFSKLCVDFTLIYHNLSLFLVLLVLMRRL